jgi:hypothetical protein
LVNQADGVGSVVVVGNRVDAMARTIAATISMTVKPESPQMADIRKQLSAD